MTDAQSNIYDFYPASGGRVGDSGGLIAVGLNGYAWSNASGSAAEVRSSYLNFFSSYVYPEFNDRRAYGFPVRCVQE